MKKPLGVLLLPLVLLLTPRVVSADPINIISGSLVLNPFNGPITLVGDRGFTFESGVNVSGGFFLPWEQCDNLHSPEPCLPGSSLGLTATWLGNDVTGPATLDGVTYSAVGSLSSSSSMNVQFLGTAVLPPLSSSATVTAPFTFEGSFFHPVDGMTVNDPLTGSGFATLLFSPTANGTWHLDSARYDFGNPSPTPEPASLLLMGSGILALAAFVRSRARRPDSPMS
jgi:PEP-CTERM motif